MRNKLSYGYQEEPTHDDPNRNYIADEPGLGLTPEDNKVNLMADEALVTDEFMFVSKLLNKEAVSNSVKQKIIQMFGKAKNFPSDAELDGVLKHIEKLVPNNGKVNTYIVYLAKQLWGIDPPGFVLDEDDSVIKPLIHNFDEAVSKGKLQGSDADINKYKDLENLKQLFKEDKKDTGEYTDVYSKEQKDIINKGSEVIYTGGGWVVHRVNKSNNPTNFAAAKLLCDNDLHNVGWCVGRGVTQYMQDGNFYVLEKNGISTYAISTNASTAIIWNAQDTPVWTTAGTAGSFTSITTMGKKMGLDPGLNNMSRLPKNIISVLQKVIEVDPYLAKRIPKEQVVEGDTTNLDKILYKVDVGTLVKELNASFLTQRTMGTGASILGRCIALKMDFADYYPMFKENLMLAYIELLAAAGYKSIPTSLEDYFVEELSTQ